MDEFDQNSDQDDIQSDNKGEGNGEGGEAGQTVKIGEQEYTLEQVAEMAKKSQSYDALLPDYTVKSQELAELKKGHDKSDQKSQEDDLPDYHKPGWQPKNYQELANAIKTAEERGEKRALEALQKMEDTRNQATSQLDGFVEETKKQDSQFDEQDFYEFVAKRGLSVNTMNDLKGIYSIYKDLRDANLTGNKGEKPRKDSVSSPGSGKGSTFSVPMKTIRQAGSSLEAALDALHSIKK